MSLTGVEQLIADELSALPARPRRVQVVYVWAPADDWIGRAYGDSAVYLNLQWWRASEWPTAKSHVVDPSPRGVILHEVGHLAYAAVARRIGDGAAARTVTGTPPPSRYAQSSWQELAAECYVAWREHAEPACSVMWETLAAMVPLEAKE